MGIPYPGSNTRRSWRVGASLLVAGLVISIGGCNEVREALGVPKVRLQVTDTSCTMAAVRWGDGSANDVEEVVALPWTRDLGTASGLILVLAARRECDDDATITAEIHLDGALEDRGTARGPFAVAAASVSFF